MTSITDPCWTAPALRRSPPRSSPAAYERAVPGGLLSAAQVATRLAVERSWVYHHAEELGAGGPRPRLRFAPTVVAERTIQRRPGHPGHL